MNTVGIVCEYNPLHNGHLYHIRESKRLAAADAVVCVMSGNFVQRGEPAVLDKWRRTCLALKNGVDVVLEIPVLQALGNASIYAAAGVRMLEALGTVTHLSFGSESGDLDALKRVSSRLTRDRAVIRAGIDAYAKKGYSYPAAREAAYRDLYSGEDTLRTDLAILQDPNDVLAIEYLNHLTTLTPVAVRRTGAGHGTGDLPAEGYASASAIRRGLAQGLDVTGFIPYEPDPQGFCIPDRRWFDAVRYRLLTMDPERISEAPSGGEGIGHRLAEAVREASDWNDLILRTKSKRYTYTHVSRLLCELLLGIRRTPDAADSCMPQYLRVLGATEKGCELLSRSRKDKLAGLPILTNINKQQENLSPDARRALEYDLLASDVWNLLNGRNIYLDSDRKKTIILVDKGFPGEYNQLVHC